MNLSVICPVFNEIDYIESVLNFCINATPQVDEIILIDGGSTDGTLEILDEWKRKHSKIQVLHNEMRTVPYALNMGIKASRSEVIVRLDAHTDYAPDYFEKIISAFEKSGADIVGGPTRTAFRNDIQEAVAYVICTAFGIGGSKVHDILYEGENDTVTFGAWKREIFDSTGLFDVNFRRNQDDEFHYRARSKGMRIYQSPDIKLYYYPRSSIKGLFKQYYQYGIYKPMVLKKVNSGLSLRHIIPAGFVIYLTSLPLAFVYTWWLIPFLLYFCLNLIFSFFNSKRLKIKFIIMLVYTTLHIAYGIGFIAGLFKKYKA